MSRWFVQRRIETGEESSSRKLGPGATVGVASAVFITIAGTFYAIKLWRRKRSTYLRQLTVYRARAAAFQEMTLLATDTDQARATTPRVRRGCGARDDRRCFVHVLAPCL
jgi:type VI protein secretion system component VasK